MTLCWRWLWSNTVERVKSRHSLAVIRFGLKIEVGAHREYDLQVGKHDQLIPRVTVFCDHHTRLTDPDGDIVDDLIHDFSADVRALDNLSLTVRRGEMTCIIGPSGSEKSTLLAALSGQLEQTRGQVKLNET